MISIYLVVSVAILLSLPGCSRCCTQSVRKTRYTRKCWSGVLGGIDCDTQPVYYYVSGCCPGWGGSGCGVPYCNGILIDGCSRTEGRVQLRTGELFNTSGGTCKSPDYCEDCNPGYYPDGSYCRICPAISNCLYTNCTNANDSICYYCDGEVKKQYGWYAYTRFFPGDNSKKCRRACSWRAGSRCYPGTCSDETTDSCKCIEGLTGSDCDRITEDPHVLQNFVTLTETTATSVNHVEAPPDSGSGSPQPVVWTSVGNVETFSAHVDASYKKDLPAPPENFYVKTDATKMGIINGGIKLEWMRGSIQVTQALTKSCETDPMPSDYRCEFNGNFSSWPVPFQHGDILKYTVFATNGGYVSVYNRENSNTVDNYTINGRTKTNTFEIGFDMENPVHCVMTTPSCNSKPLSLPDTTTEAAVTIRWSGWEDKPAGLESYHFEVFHLKPTGTGGDSDLVHGDKVHDSVAPSVLANVSQTTVTFPIAGPYAVTITSVDKAGNHKTARQFAIYDDNPAINLQGSRSTKAESEYDRSCTWIASPSPPIVKQADPNTYCNWITKSTAVLDIFWKERFINTKHHAGQWLNPVRTMNNIDQVLDDNEGARTTTKVNNVLGITEFQVAYNVTYEEQTTVYTFENVDDIHTEKFSINLDVMDGMKVVAEVRAIDIVGAFVGDLITVKVDTSPPVIEDLWLTKGDKVNISVHNVEDLSKLQIEWKASDIHSGLEEIYWRIFDNFMGDDFDHGTAYMSPQGNAESYESCAKLYDNYPRGADCYCTPFDGCFHQHFHVIPQIHVNGTDGLHESRHMGVHDSDYFIEVTATNKALLKTTKIIKISIDTSPPVSGSVHEGVRGEPEVDFQQDKTVMVHWSDFFDKESGIMFYRYGYGQGCFKSGDFDITLGKELQETFLSEATFEVDEEGKYYITVAAYNHALDHSEPICSDGVVIDTSIPSISEFRVEGARADPQFLRDKNNSIWFLHDDRTRQLVANVSNDCRATTRPIDDEELKVIPLRRNHRLQTESITFGQNTICRNYIVDAYIVTSVIHNWKHLELSWKTENSDIDVFDFEIGISTTKSEIPDLLEFTSAHHHTRLTIQHPNIEDGSVFYFVVKSVSRSDVQNIQIIGPFMLLTSPPVFDEDIKVTSTSENLLIATWNISSLQDYYSIAKLDFQFAVGSKRYGTDVHPFSDLIFSGDCESTNPPTCTAIDLDDLDWDLHHGQEYYITIRINDTAGLVTRATSRPYKHDILPPSAGVVIDVDTGKLDIVNDNEDIDYQKSSAEISARWFGFDHFYSEVQYTACITDEKGEIITETCKFVGNVKKATLLGAQLMPFKKYKILVNAETETSGVSVLSDGVIIIDDKADLNDILLFDGEECMNDTVILSKENTHHNSDVESICSDDNLYQSSVHKISVRWVIPETRKPFMPDLHWHIEERAPVVDYWTSKTWQSHIAASAGLISINFPLIPGRTYRFGLTFCASEICYNTRYSSGITVIPSPPKTGTISVTYNSHSRRIIVVFEKFYDEDIEDIKESQGVMDYYEWNIADNHVSGRVVQKWTRLENVTTVNETHVEFEIVLMVNIQFTKCWNFLLRGTNKVGASSIAAKAIKPCEDLDQVKPATVIDCVVLPAEIDDLQTNFSGSPVKLGLNERWFQEDIDYTPYSNILSAVWPGLKHTIFEWAVIELHSNDPVMYYSESPSFQKPCDSPDKIICGTTEDRYVNVYFESNPLRNGHRYAVCIYADAETLAHEYWNEDLPEVSTCSDGVTVDTTPPQPGNVWINHKDSLYQSSRSEVTIYWERFLDIDELGNHVHESGMSHYEVALGSYSGGADVVASTNVGIVSHVTLHDLHLQDGHNYFATVTGYDFTGRHSSVTSTPITVDTTPPDKSNKEITLNKNFITELNYIESCWKGVFQDQDSGMAYYKWAVGSKPGYDDKYKFTKTTDICSDISRDQSLLLEDGHSYYITVMGFNNAGLFSIASSWAFTVDTTPPVRGYIYDGKRRSNGSAFDIDYQRQRSEISAHWGGFYDPHTPVKEYIIGIGTSKGGYDILNAQPVGAINDLTVDHLELREGSTYFVTITACNVAGLCVNVTSDGVLVDSSPPVPGKTIDGCGSKDIRYQASSTYIAAKWFGFTDPQSGLSHFTWRVGTSVRGDDIVAEREVHLHEMAVIPDLNRAVNKVLPIKKTIYNTIRAYNKAGLYSESVSNGFFVDETAPVFKTLRHVPIGSLRQSTSVLRSSLKVRWDVVDPESYISEQYLSIAAHRGDDFNSTIKIGGVVRDYTFTKLSLHDGSLYSVKVTACNGAQLCVSSILPELLVDSTPPTAGTFAINTDHAVSNILNRQPENWMTWEFNRTNLAWLGFSDIHSGILEYHVNIGSSFMSDDLNEIAGQVTVILHEASKQENDGLQTHIITTQPLQDYDHVFVSIWAVNGVGLQSQIVHSQFLMVPGGSMDLVRRCDSHTCEGHCVCAAQNTKCTVDEEDCNDNSGNQSYAELEVDDMIYLTGDVENGFEGTHTPTDTMLSAKWFPKSGVEPIWYEWSVGLSNYDLPGGIFDSHARIWHDAGRHLSWTFTLPRGSYLVERQQYSFFVRAWFNKNTFSVFKSRGVIIQTKSPETSSLFGKSVKEALKNKDKDVDYARADDELFALWDGKFKNATTFVSRYRLFISSEPNGHDIHSVQDDISADTIRYNITGLYPDTNTRYYTSIVAYNHAGLHSIATSDGCEIDDDDPTAGLVYDGLGFRDINYQTASRIVSASWQGFVDLGSSLKSYHWCVSPAADVGSCSLLPREDIGLVNRDERRISIPIPNGLMIVSEVYAVDLVGHASDTVLSDGVVVDETPPERIYHSYFGQNMLANPSFEESSATYAIANVTITHSCPYDSPKDWRLGDNSCGITVKSTADAVPDGTAFLILKGSVSQTVTDLNQQSVYILSFYTSHVPVDNSTKSNKEGFVAFDGEKHVFVLYSKPNRSDHDHIQLSWHFHTFTFQPRQSEAIVEIGTFDNSMGISIDAVELRESIVTTDKSIRAEGHVRAHTVFLHDWSSVHASWKFDDEESGIKEYMWAIGTVQGGIQLQNFKSVGTRLFDSNNNLHLPHNITIYISVVAVNGAGLRTISYSDPISVDLTPPEFEYVNDGHDEGKDVDFQNSMTIGINFKVSDPESGIDLCSWGIGIQPGDISVQQFETLPYGQFSSENLLQEHEPRTKLYVVVRCKNKAGLVSTMSSDGVTILKEKPPTQGDVVEIIGRSPTQYLAFSNYHGTGESFRIRWTGFDAEHWIQKYKVAVRGPSQNVTSYIYENSQGYTYATLIDFPFEDGLYNVSVTGINYLDTESDPVSTSVNVLTQTPKIKSDIDISWDGAREEITVTWSDVFYSTSPLYYEVSAGSVKGGGDIIQWQETSNTELMFKLTRDDVGLYGKTIYTVVRAITLSGTYNTAAKEQLISVN